MIAIRFMQEYIVPFQFLFQFQYHLFKTEDFFPRIHFSNHWKRVAFSTRWNSMWPIDEVRHG
jgi:hypothetical protein